MIMKHKGSLDITQDLTVSGSISATLTLIETYSGHIEQPGSGTETYTLEQSIPFTLEIQEYIVQMVSGTGITSITIDNTPITGIDHKTLNTNENTYTATGLNNVAIGETIRLTASGADIAQDLTFTLKVQRTVVV